MAAMTTVPVEFSNNGNSRTSTLTGHTTEKPILLIESRKVPSGQQIVAENSITVLSGTTDSNDIVLPQKYSISVNVRGPVNGTTADRDAIKAFIRDIVASDNFDSVCSTQNFLVP